MKYLIVKFDYLNDQYECDADRVPMYLTDDWVNNAPTDYDYEVYEVQPNNFLQRIVTAERKLDGTYTLINEKEE